LFNDFRLSERKKADTIWHGIRLKIVSDYFKPPEKSRTVIMKNFIKVLVSGRNVENTYSIISEINETK